MENAKDSITDEDLSIQRIATYQPFDELMEMKVEMFNVLLSGFVDFMCASWPTV